MIKITEKELRELTFLRSEIVDTLSRVNILLSPALMLRAGGCGGCQGCKGCEGCKSTLS